MKIKKYINRGIPIVLTTALILLIVFMVIKFDIFFQLLGVIILSFILSYSLRPLLNLLTRRGINKKVSSLIILLGIILVVLVIWLLLIPAIYRQSNNIGMLIEEIKIYIESYAVRLDYSGENKIINQIMTTIYSKLEVALYELATKIVDRIIAVASNITLILIVPTLVYFFLCDGEKMFNGAIKLIPVKSKGMVARTLTHIDKVMQRYIITQFELCGIIGILTYIALIVSKVDYPLLLSIINSIFNIIPYFGPVIGAIPIILIALIISPKKALIVAIWLCIIQQLEGDIISPKVLGDSVNSHPVTILLLLIIGGGIGGLMGMILVVPIWVMIKIIYDEFEYYLF